MTVALILLSVGLNALAQIFLRAAMREAEIVWSLGWLLGKALSPAMLGGLACYALSIFLWLAVLARVQVSVAYPFQALGYVFAAVVAWRFLGEGVSALNLLGLGLICAGVVVLARAA